VGIKDKVVIYTAGYCPYCDAAKDLLDSREIPYKEIHTSKNDGTWKEMEKLSGNNTVPQIFINSKAIGGFDDLTLLNNNNELKNLLK
jgi:glutaredoxin 3|tara:strand:+ start:89 stop:349 length:261 start_codon:yes stop_codon:yes gene_type:complete